MTTTTDTKPESRAFEADVARLLHLMVHSVYSDKDVFLRELISNAADASERLRYEAIATPALLGEDAKARITIKLDPDAKTLTVEDNGIGMNREDGRRGPRHHRALRHEGLRRNAPRGQKGQINLPEPDRPVWRGVLLGLHGRRQSHGDLAPPAGDKKAGVKWESEGKGDYTVEAAALEDAPVRGTRVVLHLMEDAKDYTERFKVERIVKANSGHVPVPISIVDKPGAEATELADGAALWTKPRSEIKPEDYTDFYRSVAGAYRRAGADRSFPRRGPPRIHRACLRAERAAVRSLQCRAQGADQALRQARVHHRRRGNPAALSALRARDRGFGRHPPQHVARDDPAEPDPRGDPEGPGLGACWASWRSSRTYNPEAYAKFWDTFGEVMKEGFHEDYERAEALLALTRFKTTTRPGRMAQHQGLRGVAEGEPDLDLLHRRRGLAQLEASPHSRASARVASRCCCSRRVDSFWATRPSFEGSRSGPDPGLADLA